MLTLLMDQVLVTDGQLLDGAGQFIGSWLVTPSGRLWIYDRRRPVESRWMRDDGLVGDRRVIADTGLDGMDRLFPNVAEA